MTIKKEICLILLFLFASSCFSIDKEVTLVMIDGSQVSLMYPENTQTIVLFDSDLNNRQTKYIYGLGQFPYLRTLEFQSLAFLESYDFLSELSSCEELYINTGPFFDFSILKSIKNLKKLEFRGYVTQEQLKRIKSEGIDISSLANLEEFIFSPFGTTIDVHIKISQYSDGLLIKLP